MDGEEFGRSLVEALQEVPDPRKARGKRHPLGAISDPDPGRGGDVGWGAECGRDCAGGRLQEAGVVQALGYTREKTPAGSTFHEVFKALDVEAFEVVLSRWAQQHLGPGEAIAIDGKALREMPGEELPGVRLVAAYAHRADRVLAQAGGPASTERGTGRD